MPVINLPPMLRTILGDLDKRIRKLEQPNTFEVPVLASDPKILRDGMMWYRTSDKKFMTRDNGVVRPVGEMKNWAALGDTTTQTLASTASVQAVKMNTFAAGANVTLNADKVYPTYSGVYNIQFSIVFDSTDSQARDAIVWLRVDNVDVAYSGTHVTVPSKHGSLNGKAVMTVNYAIQLNAGSYFQLWWIAEATTVSIPTIPASTTPVAYPATPGVIMTVTQAAW